MVAKISVLTLGLGRLGVHHHVSNSLKVSAWEGAGEHKGEQSQGAVQDAGGGERNILTPDSYFLRPTGGSCVSF